MKKINIIIALACAVLLGSVVAITETPVQAKESFPLEVKCMEIDYSPAQQRINITLTTDYQKRFAHYTAKVYLYMDMVATDMYGETYLIQEYFSLSSNVGQGPGNILLFRANYVTPTLPDMPTDFGTKIVKYEGECYICAVARSEGYNVFWRNWGKTSTAEQGVEAVKEKGVLFDVLCEYPV